MGNCKDYAIAKFFTLKAMGVAESKLNLTYAKALRYNKAHLSLTYYSNPGADPLILDNMIDEILPGYEREDLVPVFSFNSSGLWLASQRGRGRHVGSPDRLGGWMDMLKRMSRTGGSAAPHRENNGSRTANFDSVFEAHPMAVPSHSH
ncbi:MAG: transglutaminase-like cysteine peptidase [Syntrophobacterales bacterium]|nr:transglutaminase-like cysteine peptidase [Syntrophobacterales bacterium]